MRKTKSPILAAVHETAKGLHRAGVMDLQTDERLYERGPGNLVAMVRLRSGKVQSIRYGRVPE